MFTREIYPKISFLLTCDEYFLNNTNGNIILKNDITPYLKYTGINFVFQLGINESKKSFQNINIKTIESIIVRTTNSDFIAGV